MNFFRGRPEVPSELASARTELEKLVRDYRELENAASTLSGVLDAMFLTEADRAPIPEDTQDLYLMAWGDRRPAFFAVPPALGFAHTSSARLGHHQNPSGPERAGLQICLRIDAGQIDLGRWASLWFSGEPARQLLEAEELGIDADTAVSIFRFTLMPSLARMTRQVDAPENWRSSSCPYCDGEAVIGELRGLEGGRFLRCGLCAADWAVDRLGCPGCGELDHRHLKSLAVEGEVDRRRLFLCESCGLRLKVVQSLARLSPPSLVVAELATCHLNYL